MKKSLLLVCFALLCAVAGASVSHAFGVPLLGGGALGLGLGLLPAVMPRRAGPCAEALCLVLLIAVAVATSLRGLLPVLADGVTRIEDSIPLLLMAPALYVVHMALLRNGSATRPASVMERVAAALSGPPIVLTLALAMAVATGAVLAIHYVGLTYPGLEGIASKFVDRGIIPPLTLVLFFWGLLLLANKGWVLWRERRLLESAAPRGPRGSVLAHARRQSLRDGELAAAGEFLDLVWKKSADFYIVPRYINWAIPILGFIGTVLGISLAADGIQTIIGSGSSLSDLSSELGQAIAPLGIAFDTTLIALSLSVLLTLIQTGLQRWEDNVLVDYEGRVRAESPARS